MACKSRRKYSDFDAVWTDEMKKDWKKQMRNHRREGSWTGPNIALMVLGFVFFWPLGLVALWGNIRGYDFAGRIGGWLRGVGEGFGLITPRADSYASERAELDAKRAKLDADIAALRTWLRAKRGEDAATVFDRHMKGGDDAGSKAYRSKE